MSAGLINLLAVIRQHHAYAELLAAVEAPRIRPYKPGRAVDADSWRYESGQVDQHERWLMLLTGKSEQEKL